MKQLLYILILLIAEASFAQNVTIPDANFKSYLLGNSLINTNSDTEIQLSEATAFGGTISCINMSISDLTGIEAFTSITKLFCGNNQLTSIDVSNNTALLELDVQYNSLTTIDVSNLTALRKLWVNNNSLSSLDVSANTALRTLFTGINPIGTLDVSNNLLLEVLGCYSNNLTTLDVSMLTNLEGLTCYQNSITALNLSNCPDLYNLHCGNNSLTSLDVSMNPDLIDLICSDNQISILNLQNLADLSQLMCENNQLSSLDVSNNTVITLVSCSDNQLSSLDLSSNTSLLRAWCNNNQLTSLNLANGNNASILGVTTWGNPNLVCIKVDDASYSTSNWVGGNFAFDAGTGFDENCLSASLEEEFAAIDLLVYPNPAQDLLVIRSTSSEEIAIVDVLGTVVAEYELKPGENQIFIPDVEPNIYFIKTAAGKSVKFTKQ